MAIRTRLGALNGVTDLWVSKPGVNVLTAQPGQFLLGGSDGLDQIIASGRQALQSIFVTMPSSHTVALPAALAGLTDIFIHGSCYLTTDAAGQNIQVSQNLVITSGFRIVNGALQVVTTPPGNVTVSLGTFANPAYLWAQWVVFRGRY